MFITGIGIISSIGQGKTAYTSALMEGKHAFGVMNRPGRQFESSFIGAEIPDIIMPENITKKVTNTVSFTAKAAIATLDEAWQDAALDEVDPLRIGLAVGGSNFNQRELLLTSKKYAERPAYIRPSHGFLFFDSDLCGVCTEFFNIQNFAFTAGGSSASGQLAIIQAIQAVEAGTVDVCIALGALMDLSYLECYALRSLGAMGTDRYAHEPASACRPFDKNRDGFIYGENCAAIVIESTKSAEKRQVHSYARISGWSIKMDRNRNPNPSYEGEVFVINQTLKKANLLAADIDYINPHGTGSIIGDDTEVKAIKDCGLSHAYINSTKSITGHGLTAAGAVEIATTVLQMREGTLHPSRNLTDVIDADLNWVTQKPVSHSIKNALSLSMGFGGINTAISLQKL